MNAIMPPLVIDVRVRERDAKGFRIWFPFFLLWPLLLILVGFSLVFTVIIDVALLLANARYHHYTLLLINTLRVLASIRGTRGRIDSKGSFVDFDIY